MKKLFISQSMRGKTDAEIHKERDAALDMARELFGEFVLIDSVLDLGEHKKPLYYLGESLKLLSEADIVMFLPGWEEARGCRIEHECALEYGAPLIVDKW